MTALVLGSLSIWCAWLFLAVCFGGLGLAIQRLFGVRKVDTDSCLMAFWMGWSAAICVLQIWHLFFALRWAIFGLVVVLGGAGIVWHCAEIRRWLSAVMDRTHVPWLIVLGLGSVWIANQATAPCNDYDLGIYHLQAVEWAKHYAIVPGLGNLHSRLAFNDAHLLYAAMIENGPWKAGGCHLANGLLILMVCMQGLVGAARLWWGATRRALEPILSILLLLPVIGLIPARNGVTSLSTDVVVALLLFIVVAKLGAWLHEPIPRSRKDAYAVVWITTLLAVAVCVKLSAVVFALLAWLLTLGLWWYRNHATGRLVGKTFGWVSLIALLLGVPWGIRSVILSGYLAYPSSAIPVDVDWRVPREQADVERAWIGYYSRFGENDDLALQPPHTWWRAWWRARLRSVTRPLSLLGPVILIAMTAVAAGIMRYTTRREPRLGWRFWLLLVPTIGGLLFWFGMAPSPRFGGWALWWILALMSVSNLLFCYAITLPRSCLKIGIMGLVVIATLPLGARVAKHVVGASALEGVKIAGVLVRPHPTQWWYPVSVPELTTYVTQSGLTLNVPEADNSCWRAELPCTPHPARNLILRQPGDFALGFKTSDGRWLQEDYPNKNLAEFRHFWRSQSR